ncbi:hypothetical protein WICMUC_001576 [Wickerhamomyces mucosus]|uniref:BHLH domain-containing protein n=1 Tax=Wickerhamomyces mucosus TaxID=1378264 RepID=A0A9P8PTX2_9ASCO|nr:hypothetical protein WICMUC_001576 [Wickerhamomyces mucosus]
MSYGFEDYDAFLASFNNHNNSTTNNNNVDMNFINSQMEEFNSNSIRPKLEENYTNNSLISEEDQYSNPTLWNNNFLSPDYTNYNSNSQTNSSESSPHEMFDNDLIRSNPYIKQELSKTNSLPVDYSNDSLDKFFRKSSLNNQIKLSKSITSNTGHITKNVKVKKEKASHNMIEKKYRTNINDKIQALRDSVPSLRVLVGENHENEDDFHEDEDELDGLAPAKKLNKATILSKATEYIKHLEFKNASLKRENDVLKQTLYGETSRSSVDSNNPFTNKILLGGLTCMVGSSLNNDLNSMDSRQLFALPIISFNEFGSIQFNLEFINILMKFILLIGVTLYTIYGLLNQINFKFVQEKEKISVEIDDLKLIWESFWKFPKFNSQMDNEMIKYLIFKCFQFKLKYGDDNYLINLLVIPIWNRIKTMEIKEKLSKDSIKLIKILQTSNDLTINSLIFSNKLKNFNPNLNKSLINELFKFLNEIDRNLILKKFLINSIENEIGNEIENEIENNKFDSIIPNSNSLNKIIELKTLFNPTEENIGILEKTLEFNNNDINDEIVLKCSLIIKSIDSQKNQDLILKLFKDLNIDSIMLNHENLNLLGFTSLYYLIFKLGKNFQSNFQLNEEILLMLEELSSFLRIWISENSSNYQIKSKNTGYDYKGKLVQFFINTNLRINYGGIDGEKLN